MENKKLGTILIIISWFFGYLAIQYSLILTQQGKEIGCSTSEKCEGIEKLLSFSHIAIGIFTFLLALGFYILFFNKTEKAILEKLEQEKEQKIENIKFSIIAKALDPYERKVIEAVREQEGITQNTLRLRTNMSKAKLSYVLQELEKRGLVKRIEKGKTFSIYLRI